MDADKMLGVQDAILILRNSQYVTKLSHCSKQRKRPSNLSSRIDNLCRKILPLVVDSLVESIFDGGIVAVDK